MAHVSLSVCKKEADIIGALDGIQWPMQTEQMQPKIYLVYHMSKENESFHVFTNYIIPI